MINMELANCPSCGGQVSLCIGKDSFYPGARIVCKDCEMEVVLDINPPKSRFVGRAKVIKYYQDWNRYASTIQNRNSARKVG